MDSTCALKTSSPWNKGKIVGQKTPFKLKEIWAIRIRLQIGHRTRELAMFDLGLDSKLRACDLVKLELELELTRFDGHLIVMNGLPTVW